MEILVMVLSTTCFLVRGDIMKMSKMATIAAIAGVGALSWMMLKKKKPEMVEDMKNATKSAANKMLTKLENME